jgi:hypothetical protein
MQHLKVLWDELVQDDIILEPDLVEVNLAWNQQNSYYHAIPHDVRLLIWVWIFALLFVFFFKQKKTKSLFVVGKTC